MPTFRPIGDVVSLFVGDGDIVSLFRCPSVEMNTTEFIASLESLAAIGLDELNYD
jgi:hypothetical protein